MTWAYLAVVVVGTVLAICAVYLLFKWADDLGKDIFS